MPATPLAVRPLGRTGVPVSCLGVGGYLGVLDDPSADEAARVRAAVEAVERAVALGVRYFDTSPAYGPGGAAERYLGRGLQHLPLAARDRLTVSTKVGTHPERRQQYDAGTVLWSFERSRELLGRIDVVYVHDPGTEAHLDQILGPGGAFEALEQLKARGDIRALGLGVRNHRFLRRAVESGRCDAILPSYDYHPLRATAGPLIEWAAARGVGVASASPYNAGLLAGIDLEEAARRRPPHDADLARARQLAAWCRERDVELGALAVQHSLRNRHIHTVLVGPRTAAEVAGCVRHAETALAEEVWQAFQEFAAGLQPPPEPGGEAQ